RGGPAPGPARRIGGRRRSRVGVGGGEGVAAHGAQVRGGDGEDGVGGDGGVDGVAAGAHRGQAGLGGEVVGGGHHGGGSVDRGEGDEGRRHERKLTTVPS